MGILQVFRESENKRFRRIAIGEAVPVREQTLVGTSADAGREPDAFHAFRVREGQRRVQINGQCVRMISSPDRIAGLPPA